MQNVRLKFNHINNYIKCKLTKYSNQKAEIIKSHIKKQDPNIWCL